MGTYDNRGNDSRRKDSRGKNIAWIRNNIKVNIGIDNKRKDSRRKDSRGKNMKGKIKKNKKENGLKGKY